MRDSLHALLADSLDYAGQFPPANLPLSEALGCYLKYRVHPASWLLARFVCPAERLQELVVSAAENSGRPLRLSVLGQKPEGDNYATLARLDADCALMQSLVAERKNQVSLEFYETALPRSASNDWNDFADFVDRVGAALATHRIALQDVFVEVPWQLDARDVAQAMDYCADTGFRCGLKIRTGGLEASAFPPAAELARFIVACREAGCRWKATAGLHHPLSADDRALGVWHCGFVNLFAAAVLSHAHALSEEKVKAILQESQADAFRFTKAGLAWRDYVATTQQIAAARRASLASFGSCSFDEPVDGLARLQWLKEQRDG